MPWQTINKTNIFSCGKSNTSRGPFSASCVEYFHISPEYHIRSGLGNNVATYQVLEGIDNCSGNAGNNFYLNIVAHIQYFQTNMVSAERRKGAFWYSYHSQYGCVLPLESLLKLTGSIGLIGEKDNRRAVLRNSDDYKKAMKLLPGVFLRATMALQKTNDEVVLPEFLLFLALWHLLSVLSTLAYCFVYIVKILQRYSVPRVRY